MLTCQKIMVLFVWGLSSHSRIFHSCGDVNIADEGLQILIYAWQLWPLSGEGSLASHTYFDTGHPFIMVISEDPWHSHLLTIVWLLSCHYVYLFNDLGQPQLGFEHLNFLFRGERTNWLRQCGSTTTLFYYWCILQKLNDTFVTFNNNMNIKNTDWTNCQYIKWQCMYMYILLIWAGNFRLTVDN